MNVATKGSQRNSRVKFSMQAKCEDFPRTTRSSTQSKRSIGRKRGSWPLIEGTTDEVIVERMMCNDCLSCGNPYRHLISRWKWSSDAELSQAYISWTKHRLLTARPPDTFPRNWTSVARTRAE